jgi:uncharacterized protein (DUF2384 family)
MRRPFRKASAKLPQDEGARQGRVVRSAQIALGTTEAVRAFLNSHHDGLGGRPLDIATASDAGLAAVEAAMAQAGRDRAAAGDGS